MRRKQDTSKWMEIGDDLTDKAFEDLKASDILRFNQGGKEHEYKIMRMNKKKRKCYVKPVRTYHPNEVDIVDKEKV